MRETGLSPSPGPADPSFNQWVQDSLLALARGSQIDDTQNVINGQGFGTAAYLDVGTAADDVVQLDGAAKLPALDGSALTNITATGVVASYDGTTAPAGWVMSSGRTIGDASSSATERANADTAALFALYWNDYANTLLPIQNPDGTAGTRGASAVADYAAHMRMPLPDRRGRVDAGKDDMGGTPAGNLTAAKGLDGTVLGNSGGEQKHTLSIAELPVVTPAGTIANVVSGGTKGGTGGTNVAFSSTNPVPSAFSDIIVTSTFSGTPFGSGNAHNNVQPTWITNKIIKL